MTTVDDQEAKLQDVSVQKSSEVIVGKGRIDIDQSQNSMENTSMIILAPWEYHVEKKMFEFNDEFYAIYGTSVEREGRFMAGHVYLAGLASPCT